MLGRHQIVYLFWASPHIGYQINGN